VPDGTGSGGAETGGTARIRLDKWLWHARFFKSRSLAARACADGRLRSNGSIISKAGAAVAPGDILVFPKGARVHVIRVLALAGRRGSATEAQALYENLDQEKSPDPERT